VKILFLAPHPFFQNRGTPIDVLIALRVLVQRPGTQVDLLTYREGEDIALPRLKIFRIPPLPFTDRVRPGFSLRKLWCDLLLALYSLAMVRKGGYDLIHAGEEAVFLALFYKWLRGIPYAYDLDSSIAQQLVEQMPRLRLLAPLFNALERLVLRHSVANLPVCNALAEICRRVDPRKTFTIHDISQLARPMAPATGRLKNALGVSGVLLLYCGNLEPYQGVDLLLAAFQRAGRVCKDLHLAVIGGQHEDIARYRAMAKRLGIEERTHFLGPKPFTELDRYLAEADILVSPRIRGVNTPMKVFPYLHSGRPLLATDLPTHSQILHPEVACLAPAEPEGFAAAMAELARDPERRARLGRNGHRFAEAQHTFAAHRRRLDRAYDFIAAELAIPQAAGG
jgi:glycosyltransferase involved in cell wall biosynthesis